MTAKLSIRMVNHDSDDFVPVAYDFMLGFERRFEENPRVFHRINNLDLLRIDWTTAVGYDDDGVPVAGLVIDASDPDQYLVKGMWSKKGTKGTGRKVLAMTKAGFATSGAIGRKWVAYTRILPDGHINPLAVSALRSLSYYPHRVHAFDVRGTHDDRHLGADLDGDGRYRALEWVNRLTHPNAFIEVHRND